MARTPKSTSSNNTVTVDADHYRSLVLGKLRADIEVKRALLKAAAVADVAQIQDMAYWKMAYYKMAYWKAHSIEDLEQAVINPVIGAVGKGEPGNG